MIDEVKFKRLEKRLNELDEFVNGFIEMGVAIPDSIRSEHKEVSDQYNEIVFQIKQNRANAFIKDIEKEE